MDLINYDFESTLENGFKSLFDSTEIDLRIADDIDEGEIPDECVLLELDAGGAIGEQHQNAAGEYNHYSGTLDLTIRTPRVSGDQEPTSTGFKSRHTELVARTRQLLEEISGADITANWGTVAEIDAYDMTGAGTASVNGRYVRNGDSNDSKPSYTLYSGSTTLFNLWSFNDLAWFLTSSDIDASPVQIYTISSSSATPPLTGWMPSSGDAPSPTLSIVKYAGPISPARIKPTGTSRENDERHRMTTLSYEIQFTIT